MKKLFKVLLASLLCLGLVGCSADTDDNAGDATGTPETPVLKIAGLDGGYGSAGWEAVIANFEAAEGVTVELQLEKNIAEVLRPVITSGKDIPDLIYLAVGATGGLTETMIAEKQILDISDVLDMQVGAEGVTVGEKLLPGFTDALTSSPYQDGSLYLAPINYGPCGLFYDANLLASNGWELPTTWDEMFELGDLAAEKGIALFTYPTTGYFDAFFSAVLNSVVGPEQYAKLMTYDVAAWESESTKEAFALIGKLAGYVEENTVANANAEGFTKNQLLILDNKAIFCPNGTWLPGEMADAPRTEGFEWGFTSIPAYTEGGDAYATTFVEQMYVPTSAENADLAKKFIAYCYSDEAAALFYTNGGAVMPIVGNEKFITAEDPNSLYYNIYNTGAKANAVGFAAIEKVEGVNLSGADGILYGTVNSVVAGTKTVEEWHAAVVEAVKKLNK